MYLIRLSQCKIQQSFQVAYSRDNLYHIKCAATLSILSQSL